MYKFLIVDDQEDFLFFLQERLLGTFWSTVTLAKSGKDAISLICLGFTFDLIICDFHMREGDGKTVFDYTKTQSEPVPFILHTSAMELPRFEGSNFLGTVFKEDTAKLVEIIKSQFHAKEGSQGRQGGFEFCSKEK